MTAIHELSVVPQPRKSHEELAITTSIYRHYPPEAYAHLLFAYNLSSAEKFAVDDMIAQDVELSADDKAALRFVFNNKWIDEGLKEV